MKSLKGTRTEVNILTAFAGESQARNRYTYFASAAKNEGYFEVYQVFTETADQEKEHAKRLFKFLEGGEVQITAGFPAGVIADTCKNLSASAAGENHEHVHMYPDFAKIADEEGFPEVAATMRAIAKAEAFHEKRYLWLEKKIQNKTMFHSAAPVSWRCLNCGYVHENTTEAPGKCPACAHPQAYFEVLCECVK